jgi:hypothetical protein
MLDYLNSLRPQQFLFDDNHYNRFVIRKTSNLTHPHIKHMRLTQKAAILKKENLICMHNVAKTLYIANNLGLEYRSLNPCDSFPSKLFLNYQNYFRIIDLNITHPSCSVSTLGNQLTKIISSKYFYMH